MYSAVKAFQHNFAEGLWAELRPHGVDVCCPHPVDWYGTLDAVVDGRLDPLPSIGKVIGLDEVPDAIDQARKSHGPPRVVVHPTGAA